VRRKLFKLRCRPGSPRDSRRPRTPLTTAPRTTERMCWAALTGRALAQRPAAAPCPVPRSRRAAPASSPLCRRHPVRRQRPSTPPSRPTWCRSRRCRSRSSHARKRAKGRRDSPRPAGSGPHRGAAQRRQQRTRHLASRGRSRRYARSAAAGRARPRASATIRRTYDRQRFLAVLAAGSVFRRARSRNARAANSAHARNERRRETLPRSMPPCAATVWRPGSAAESTLGFS